MSDLVESLDIVHEQLLSEEGMKVSDLPDNLKRKIKGWNLLKARLVKTPEDEKLFRSLQNQSVEIADKIQDFIENEFESEEEIQKREAEEKAEAEAKAKAEAEAKAKAESESSEEEEEEEEGDESDDAEKAEAKAKAEAEAKAKAESESSEEEEEEEEEEDNSESEAKAKAEEQARANKPKGVFGNLVMEKKILAKIKEYDPSDGRIRESDLEKIIGKDADYPEQKVHSITLRKVFLTSEYRLM